MRFQIIFFTTILIFTFFLTGCPSNPNPLNTNTNTINSNTNAANNAANNNTTLIPKKTPEMPTENNAPTLTPVVKAYYDALKKKDDAALKKVLTADFIKSVEADMKEEKKTSIAAYMAEYEVLDKPVEVRNEKIEGDKASAELKGGTYVNWTKFNFVKEDGEWKFTNQFDDNEKMK